MSVEGTVAQPTGHLDQRDLSDVARRVMITGACIAVWRLTTWISVPGTQLPALRQAMSQDRLSTISIGSMGLHPWLNAVMILLLLSVVSGTLRQRIAARPTLWIRSLTLGLAAGQAYGLTVLWQSQEPAVLPDLAWVGRVVVIVSLVSTCMLLAYLAHIVNVAGLGYGHSPFLLYVVTVVADHLPSLQALIRGQTGYGDISHWLAVSIVFGGLLTTAGITVAGLLAYRRIGRGATSSALPVLVNGILLPPMFTSAVMFFPVIAANYLAAAPAGSAELAFSRYTLANWTGNGPSAAMSALYLSLFGLLLVAFSLFVTITRSWSTPRVRRAATHLAVVGGGLLVVAWVIVPEVVQLCTGWVRSPLSEPLTWPALFVGLGWPTVVLLAHELGKAKPPLAPAGPAV